MGRMMILLQILLFYWNFCTVFAVTEQSLKVNKEDHVDVEKEKNDGSIFPKLQSSALRQNTQNKPLFDMSSNHNNQQDCNALAAELSRLYRDIPPSSYKSSGVLLTMCDAFTDVCGPQHQEDHIAASWIHHNVTGRHAIFFGQMGWILNRTVADIQCFFPTDGATDGRSDQGCGAFQFKPLDKKTERNIKIQITEYKNQIFGRDTPWESIDCRRMSFLFAKGQWHLPSLNDDDDYHNDNDDDDDDFTPGTPLGPQINWYIEDCSNKANVSAYKYVPGIVSIKAMLEKEILNHTLCHLRPEDAVPHLHQPDQTLIFEGQCHWSPHEWPSMIDTIAYFRQTYPKIFFWNEFVVKKPSSTLSPPLLRQQQQTDQIIKEDYKPVVSAVFYTHKSTYWRALVEARILGHKHLLRMRIDDPRVDQEGLDLFQCIVAASEMPILLDDMEES
jgi:hypothetical protein